HTVSLLKDASGRQIGIVSVTRDITERMKAEEKLRSINREMEQIIQVTSHDLRTPLAVVNGYSREMERFIEKLSPVLEKDGIDPSLKKALNTVQSDIRDTLKYIQSNTRKMDSLLYGLLKLSRSGRVELNIEELDMNNLMAEVLSAFGPQIKETRAALDISELPSCRGDEAQINQVFSNLIGNALKYPDPARPCCIRISGLKQAGRSVYCVEDNGIGIAPEHHEKIFEIFHQVRRSPGSGEGLGLTMVQKILERHNGSIWLESEPGKGSRFFVSLPA
ncbi:MAG: HAMP domain-containing histidine kinase, partial [Nitrospirota bacterium]|nr:HAMP domain-containing histidine kinase [Nitrospirota bacterium]